MWRAARPAGGRLYVRGTGRTKPNRTERHPGAAAQAACISRAGRRAKAGRLGRLLELLRWQAVSELGDEPAARPSTTSRHCRGRAGSRPARSMYFCYLFACRCGGIYRFRALAGAGDRDVVCVPQYMYVASCRAPIIVAHARLRPCLDPTQNPKIFKIPRHIKSCGTCMEH